jgi:hypothetical protein
MVSSICEIEHASDKKRAGEIPQPIKEKLGIGPTSSQIDFVTEAA